MQTPRLNLLAALLAAWMLQPSPAHAQSSPCGETVMVARGDTLSRIAERCNVSEAQLLRANPGLKGSADLQAGATVRLRPAGSGAGVDLDQTVNRLGAFASGVGSALGDLAGQVGATVDDLLSKNPDLQDRLRQLGSRLGVTDADGRTAAVSISPRSGPVGTAVIITAKNLPANTPVILGGGNPSAAYEVLDSALTDGNGTLQATVPVPAWAGDAGQLVFVVVSAERRLVVRSAPFEVTRPAWP